MSKVNNFMVVFIILLLLGITDYNYGQNDSIYVNGKKVEILILGLENNQAGKPVIVFENGMASSFDSWETVRNEVSKTSTVFCYNRPRIRGSENDSLPPTTEHIIANLRTMLLQKGLNPPYLLVSHSFGGAYIRTFASNYPKKLQDLFLLTPSTLLKRKDLINCHIWK